MVEESKKTIHKSIHSKPKKLPDSSEQDLDQTIERELKAKSKRQTSKKAISKKVSKSICFEISPENYFVLVNGQKIKDYRELADILGIIGEDIFYHHVRDESNDFANWIRDIFMEEKLAKEIMQVKNKFELQAKLYQHLLKRIESQF